VLTNDLTERFSLTCLRARWDQDLIEESRALARTPGLDWDDWCRTARDEALEPLLYRILRGRDVLPPPVEAGLKAAYRRNATRNALVLRELGQVLRCLAGADVRVILLKGAALVETVYDDSAVRPMADLDLLVRREQVTMAVQALGATGYSAIDAEAHPGMALEYENEILLGKPGGLPIPLEIHWSLLDSPHHQARIYMEWCWETAFNPGLADEKPSGVATPLLRAGQPRVLGPEAHLLHLCAHLAFHHRSQGLLWLHDIAEVLHFYRERLDWDLLLTKAAEFDVLLPLQTILPCVVEDWNAPLPASALDRLGRLEPSREEKRAFDRLTAIQQPVAKRFWADLSGMPGWRRRLRYGVGSMFPSPGYMRQRYEIRSKWLLPVYYPYRWLVGMRGIARARSRTKAAAGR
jgi:hypothetical protein